MNRCYTWEYRLEVQPYDKLVEVLEAFFASFPGGDYSVEHREKYKLRFRRGLWRKSWVGLGPLVADRLPPGKFNLWPLLVHVLVRPSPEVFLVTVRYELYLPSHVPLLIPAVQASVDQHARQELAQLAAYLAQCTGAPHPPEVFSA